MAMTTTATAIQKIGARRTRCMVSYLTCGPSPLPTCRGRDRIGSSILDFAIERTARPRRTMLQRSFAGCRMRSHRGRRCRPRRLNRHNKRDVHQTLATPIRKESFGPGLSCRGLRDLLAWSRLETRQRRRLVVPPDCLLVGSSSCSGMRTARWCAPRVADSACGGPRWVVGACSASPPSAGAPLGLERCSSATSTMATTWSRWR